MIQEKSQMKSVKFSKEDQTIIMKSLEEQDFETFISYFRNTDLLVECEYMVSSSKSKLAPTESAEFQVGRRLHYAKITEMIKIRIQNEWAGFIKGQLYYRLKDFEDCINEFPKLRECTSKDIFLTEQTKWFLSSTFQSKIQVNPIEFYSKESMELQELQYYTRAEYNTLDQQFKPPISEWSTYCFCKSLYDPCQPYIQCDSCGEWVHYICSGKSDKELKNISRINFICLQCVEQRKIKKLNQNHTQTSDRETTKYRTFNNSQRKQIK